MATATPVRGILLDIEGTTSSIRFVYDEMFPYVRRHVEGFLQQNWSETAVQECLPLLAADLGHTDLDQWMDTELPESEKRSEVVRGVIELMDGDVKATGLKQLQGLVWKDGFHSGQLVAHLYDDVAPAIESWVAAGVDVRIYSSGSIAAQKLFFGHCVAGDLLPSLSGHYDTTTGPKKEADSYRSIADDFGMKPEEILFVSDVVDELVAAAEAGLQTRLSLRPGNPPQGESHSFCTIEGFDQIQGCDATTA